MYDILANILSLSQYKNEIEHRLESLYTDKCEGCGKLKPWRHGNYPRKSGRNDGDAALNPILIQRYYCSRCKKTMSALPECIPPRRWYLWETQQTAILLMLLGGSARAVEKQVKPSRHTIKRWVAWFIVQFRLHKDALCSHFPSLGLFTEPVSFWRHVFEKFPLSTAMRLCHVSGVIIP